MKKTKTLLGLIFALSINCQAQNTWNTTSTTVTTTTPGNCYIQGDQMTIGSTLFPSYVAPGDILTVKDQIGLWPSGPSLGVTRLNGNTPLGAFLLQSNTSQVNGPSIGMYGAPGNFMIRYISPNSNPFTGHIFQSYDGNNFQTNTTITNDGRMMIGQGLFTSWAAPKDILTVKDQIGFWPSGPSLGVVRLNGNTPGGAFLLQSNTSQTDGSWIGMYGTGSSTGHGIIRYVSLDDGLGAPLGHSFESYTTTGGYQANAVITNDGRMIVGKGLLTSWANPHDVLTVRDQIGLWASGPSLGVTRINGNAGSGAFLLHSNTSETDGSWIGMYGTGASTGHGIIRYVSLDDGLGAPLGHSFESYTTAGGYQANAVITNDGRMIVGKGLLTSWANPHDVLTVRDQIGLWPSGPSLGVTRINGNASGGALILSSNTNEVDGCSVTMYASGPGTGGGEMKYSSHSTNSIGHLFGNYDPSVGSPTFKSQMAILSSGKVVIGEDLINSGPIKGDYLLYVSQGILTEHIKVAIKSTSYWSDFVFNKNYSLRSLNEVETFISRNKHLPDVPSAEDVVKNGVDVGGMDAKLLQKIEELTLYAIQQQKEINELKNRLDKKTAE